MTGGGRVDATGAGKTSPDEGSKILADYALVFDLFSRIAVLRDEEEVIDGIIRFLNSICNPAYIAWLTFYGPRRGDFKCLPRQVEPEQIMVERLSGFDKDHDWTRTGKGFILRIKYSGEKLGIIELEGLAFPEYREHYLNLALNVADVLGLAITNARTYQALLRKTAVLAAANKELESFSYSVSHDLRAPLRGIDGFSLAVLQDYGDKLDTKGKDYLRRIRGGVTKMSGLIDDILKLSRITREEIRMEQVELTQIARLIAKDMKEHEPWREVEFIIGETHAVNGDAKLLRVALENLIGNAWKFTGKTKGAKIEFGETSIGGETAFFVRDNGAGFDPEQKDTLFSPFRRLHSAAEYDGTGIGLATVNRVIARHDGRVWAEGEVNKGATIYFVI